MSQPDICAVLDNWWGNGWSSTIGIASIAQASNLAFACGSGNPPYQLSDFLASYPKFGTGVQGVQTALVGAASGSGGKNYVPGDVLSLLQPGASGCTLTVATVDGSGAVLTFNVTNQGMGYSVATGLATSGGEGAGCLVDVLLITPFNTLIPTFVMQMYINLATSSLQSNRWGTAWIIGIGLFVAHFCTLYLQSEGNPGSTPGAVASSGLAGGIIISQSAGDVSQATQPLQGLEQFAAWNLTIYGQQLATFAQTIGIGMVYAY